MNFDPYIELDSFDILPNDEILDQSNEDFFINDDEALKRKIYEKSSLNDLEATLK